MSTVRILALGTLALLLAAGCSKRNTPTVKQNGQAATWTAMDTSAFPTNEPLAQQPSTFQPWQLNMKRWKAELAVNRQDASRMDTVMLPMHDGTLAAFAIRRASVMSPKLQEKFPDLHSWWGRSISQPVQTAQLNLDHKGFHAMIQTEKGTVLVEPAFKDHEDWYMAFVKNDLPAGSNRHPSPPVRD